MEKPLQYISYLLRLWRDTDAGPWRATLVDGQSGQLRSFADAVRLIAFLTAQMGPELGAEPPEAAGGSPPGGHDETNDVLAGRRAGDGRAVSLRAPGLGR